MKCRIHKCKGACCHNIVFDNWEHIKFADKIVTPIKFTVPLGYGLVMFTDEAPAKNKCPFLRKDYKCNIYENRPDVCRKFGVIEALPCQYIKK